MTNITDSTVVYVSSSNNADYVEATQHEDSVMFIRANVVAALLFKVATGPYQGQIMEQWITDVMNDAADALVKINSK